MAKAKVEVSNQKVLWAVDAFPDSPDVQAQAARGVRMLLEGISATIEPVFVARPEPLGIVVQASPDLHLAWMESAKRNLNQLLKLAHLEHVTSPRILNAPSPSIGAMVKTLLDCAKKESFDLIVVGTHARKGVARLFMGSFAERLILDSPIPVLVTNTKSRLAPGKKVKHFLFPTDFSESSREAFAEVVALAKHLKADILLFHQMEFVSPQVVYPFIVPPMSQESFNDVRQAREALGREWIQWATTEGVRAKFHFSKPTLNIVSAITKAAKKLPSCVIALAAQSNRAEAVLLGSVTRQVVRAASCPVYVIHPATKKASEPLFRLADAALSGRALLS